MTHVMDEQELKFAGTVIGVAHPPYIVAELSCNHMGKLERALRLVEEAAKAGVDAVKLQTARPDMITEPRRPRFPNR